MAIERELFDKLMIDHGFLAQRVRDTLWKYTNVSECEDEMALRVKIIDWILNQDDLEKRLLRDIMDGFEDDI